MNNHHYYFIVVVIIIIYIIVLFFVVVNKTLSAQLNKEERKCPLLQAYSDKRH